MKLISSYNRNETLITNHEAVNKALENIPIFHLEQVPILYKNAFKRRFIVDSNGNLIAIVSRNYKLTQPRIILSKLLSIIAQDIEKLSIYYQEGKVYAKCILNKLLLFDDERVKAGFIYVDSVDKSVRLKLIFAPTIMSCGNDLILYKSSLSSRHVGLINTNVDQFLKEFNEWIADIRELKHLKKYLTEIEIKEEEAIDFVDSLHIAVKYKKQVDYSKVKNMWDLYMQLTNILTKNKAPIQYHFEIAKLTKV